MLQPKPSASSGTQTVDAGPAADLPADWRKTAKAPDPPPGVDPAYASLSYDFGLRVGTARAEDLAEIAARDARDKAASEIQAAKAHYQ